MQVGRIVFVLTEDESDRLLSILDNSGDEILKKALNIAKRTIFIDDYRPENVELVNE